jgi:hypothetical protein
MACERSGEVTLHLRWQLARSREYRQSRPGEALSTREFRALLMSHQPFPTKLASFRKKLRPGRVPGSVCRVFDLRSSGHWVRLSHFPILDPAAGGFVRRVFDSRSCARWVRLARFRLSLVRPVGSFGAFRVASDARSFGRTSLLPTASDRLLIAGWLRSAVFARWSQARALAID